METTWTGVTLLSIFGPTDPLLGGRLTNWIFSMMVGTPLALVLSGALVVADLVLVLWRPIPVGRSAWISSSVAPIVLGVVYALHRPGQYDTALGIVLATAAPLIVVALASRLIFGAILTTRAR